VLVALVRLKQREDLAGPATTCGFICLLIESVCRTQTDRRVVYINALHEQVLAFAATDREALSETSAKRTPQWHPPLAFEGECNA
jgi:hypothetical protein